MAGMANVVFVVVLGVHGFKRDALPVVTVLPIFSNTWVVFSLMY